VLVLLGGDAGLRIGEIIALDWARVDYAANKVHVEVSDWQGPPRPAQGRQAALGAMTPRLRAALRELERRDPTPAGRRAC
jgi:integrase